MDKASILFDLSCIMQHLQCIRDCDCIPLNTALYAYLFTAISAVNHSIAHLDQVRDAEI